MSFVDHARAFTVQVFEMTPMVVWPLLLPFVVLAWALILLVGILTHLPALVWRLLVAAWCLLGFVEHLARAAAGAVTAPPSQRGAVVARVRLELRLIRVAVGDYRTARKIWVRAGDRLPPPGTPIPNPRTAFKRVLEEVQR